MLATLRRIVIALALSFGLILATAAGPRAEPARQYGELLTQVGDGDAEGQYKLARWCLKNALPERARRHFEETVRIDADHDKAHEALGHVQVDGHWRTPRQALDDEFAARRSAIPDGDAEGWASLADWCLEKRRIREAELAYRRAVEIAPDHARARQALSAEPDGKVEKLIARAITEPKDRDAALREIRKKDGISEGDIGRWLFRIRQLTRGLRPHHDGSEDVVKLHHPEFPIRYRVLGKREGRGLSLLILLHSGGPSGPINDMTWSALTRHEGAPYDLIAMPRVWDDTTGAGWVYESGIVAVEAMLRELMRTYDIDPDQVFLNGYSMGGYGTSYIGAVEADRFASLGVCAAGHAGAGTTVDNQLHVPVTIHIGAEDHESDHVGTSREYRDFMTAARDAEPGFYVCDYHEYPGTGHQLSPDAQTGSFAWQKQYRRNAQPLRVIWTPISSERYPTRKRHFYWLGTPEPQGGGRIDARIVGNTVSVESQGVPRFSVFLNDALIDPTKPVTVQANGKKVHRGKLRASLSTLVETYLEREDLELAYPYRVDVGR